MAAIFFIENTQFQETLNSFIRDKNKLSKNQENLYAKSFEQYTATIFNVKSPRISSSDTRPDIPVTSSDLDNLLGSSVNPPEGYADREQVVSFIELLRSNLQKVEGKAFEEVSSAFIQAANGETDSERKKALLQTIGGIEVKGSFGVDIVDGNITRITPRGLTTRSIGSFAKATPVGSSLIIPISSGISGAEEGGRRLINSFFSRNKEILHSAITGEYSGRDQRINYFKNSAAVKQLRAKGQNLWMQYIVKSGDKLKSYSAYLPESFTVANTDLKLLKSSLYVSYKTSYENQVLGRLQAALSEGASKSLDVIIRDSDLQGLLAKPPSGEIEYRVPTGGSIPIGNAKLPTSYIPRREKSAFMSRTEAVRSILRESRPYLESIGDFITDDAITSLTKREMLRRMPKGPVGGRPLSSRVLTFRTGNFVNSVEVIRNLQTRQISYYYSPNYWIHEKTSRNPRNLISSSIASVVQSIFKQRYNIVKTQNANQ